MSASEVCPLPSRPNLNLHLREYGKAPDELRRLINYMARACKYISYSIQTTEAGLSGIENQYGEAQLALDALSDDLIRQYLCESHLCNQYVSEEQEEIVKLYDEGPYTVAFDPLDGSSLVDANFTIGSIFGIYEGNEIIGRTPREQVAAMYVLYGPRTIFCYSTGHGVHSFILNDVGEYILLQDNLTIGDPATHYSPGNLRAIQDNEKYNKLMMDWLDRTLTLRYSGCMVPDIHHILVKGQGVFTNLGGNKYPDGKLRHAIECGPFAYIIENAGGKATDGTVNLLDKPIDAINQRTQIIAGSASEVDTVMDMLNS